MFDFLVHTMALSMLNHRGNRPFILFLTMSIVFSSTLADEATDKEECTQQLVGMATCLPYVGGDAKAPTPDCCNGLKEVLKTNKKCLCVIIRDRNDPDLGLQINVTLALGLPNVCHSPANVSKCPELLNLPPDSPEAQVFYQLSNGSSTPATSSNAPAPGPSGVSANSEGVTSSGSRNGPEKGEASIKQRRWLGLETALIGVVLLWVFV